MYARKQRLQLCVLCGLRSQVSNKSQLEIVLARKDVSQGWGGEGAGGWGGVPGYWVYYCTCQTMSDSLLELLVLDGLFLGLITQK